MGINMSGKKMGIKNQNTTLILMIKVIKILMLKILSKSSFGSLILIYFRY